MHVTDMCVTGRSAGPKRVMNMAGAGLAAWASLMLAACDNSSLPSEPVLLDQRLAGIYEASCATCHEIAETGAPLSHDVDAWAPRMAQGDDTLLDHMANGFMGMPPLGQCFDCSGEDLLILAHFMAAPAPHDQTGRADKTPQEASPQGVPQEGTAP